MKIMEDGRQTHSAFWSAGGEDNPDSHDDQEAERYGSASPDLSYEAYMEKQTALNDAWIAKIPDDMVMMRYEIETQKANKLKRKAYSDTKRMMGLLKSRHRQGVLGMKKQESS